MKKLMIIAALACATAKADNWQEMLDEPQSGDRVVLNDKTYVLFSEDDFSALTNKMTILVSLAHRQWNIQHKTEDGRRAWHGAKIETIVTNGTKTTVYADGYRFVETFTERKTPVRPPLPKANKPPKPDFSKIPPRLRAAKTGVDYVKEVK